MKAFKAELKQAVYDQLTTDIDWTVLEQGAAEKNQPYPFVEIGLPRAPGENSVKGGSGITGIGVEVIIPFHIWSNWISEKESDEIEEDIQESITFSNDASPTMLTMTNWNVIRQDYESSVTLEVKDESGHLRHVVLEIRFLLQQK